jgi:putative addiction module killer protein
MKAAGDARRLQRGERPKIGAALPTSRLSAGNPGDVKPVGQGMSELRIDYGPGYRLSTKTKQ